MNKKLIRKMQTAAGGPFRIQFTPEQIALFERQATRVPGMNNSGGNRYREEGILALQHLEQEAKRKELEILSRMEMRPTLKNRKITTAEKLQGKEDEYELKPQVIGMSGADPLLSFYVGGIGLNGIGSLAKTGLWNVAKYAPTTQLGNYGRLYFVGNAFKNSFNGAVPTLTSQTTSLLYQPAKLNESGLTSLKFFERPILSNAQELAGATKWERNFKPEWHVANYPGYLLKGLMKESLLEKQLSKNGTININLLNAYFNKTSQLEKEVANKVLAEKFAGQKTIDYNLFKKAVLDELVTYNRNYNAQSMIPTMTTEKMMAYGGDRLGIIKDFKDIPDGAGGLVTTWTKELPVLFKQFTFETPKISIGNRKHYSGQPIGHTRTFTNQQEPLILHVMESQSDWAQKSLGLTKAEKTAIQNIDEQLKTGTPTGFSTLEELQVQKQAILDRASQRTLGISYLSLHLHDNYLQRLLQENLKYAAENGLTKMRYPTSETAAKIEGYLKVNHTQLNELSNLQMKLGELFENGEISWEEYDKMIDAINKLKKELFGKEYDPKHQTILKKYADFPKLFLKLFKDLQVRTVTDAKGNTWYEVDVPKGYLSREWLFKQGGKINMLEFLKSGGQIRKMLTAAGGPINYKRWDNAKITSYTIPYIKEKVIKLTNAGKATGAKLSTNLLDSLADNAYRAGLPIRKGLGIAFKESTFGNPTDDKSAWNLSSKIRELFNDKYPGTYLHINNGHTVLGQHLINYHKGDVNHEVSSENNPDAHKSVIQEAFEFYKQHPDKYNPGLKNYQLLIDKRGNEAMQSSEVLKWYKEWEKSKAQIFRPEPYKINTNIQNTTQEFVPHNKQGGKMNTLEFLKNGSGIHIKKKNRGKFTSYCGGKVTDECILKGKNSSNPAIRKRATFAANARKWKHLNGGIIKADEGTKLNFGLKVNNFFNSDLGQTITNGVSLLFNGILLANNLSKLNDRLLKWKLAYINSILPEDYTLEIELEEQLLKQANPDYNSSPITMAHLNWLRLQKTLNSIKLKASLEADMIIQLQLSNQLLSSGGGFNIGNMILTGLGIFSSLLGNKKLATSV